MEQLPAVIRAMLKADFYPDPTLTVQLLQTHISYILLAGSFVYKVKKPVDFGFLDFTSLAKRQFYVEEELRLNARFSPHIYLAVVPITEKGGGYILDDDSHVVEYALKMKRISEDAMLYRLLAAGSLTVDDMHKIAVHLAEAYEKIPSDEKAKSFGTVETVGHNVKENFQQTRKYIGGPISWEKFEKIEAWSITFLDEHAELFEKRIADGYIKECHGDLHLQHVCIEKDIVSVFDCIEFNERFRYGDVAADVAFLAMDLDYNGCGDLGGAFVSAYVKASGDRGLVKVLRFYKAYRAYVRAKVTSFMLDDKGIPEELRGTAMQNAAKYYDLAYTYVTGRGGKVR